MAVQEIQFRGAPVTHITVKANGGSVTVAVQHKPGVFIDADVFTEDVVKPMSFGHCYVRFTTTGSAEFALR